MSETTNESSTLLTVSPSRVHQELEENDESDEETINQEARTLESYLKLSGFGVFHVFLLLVSGLATAADAVEIFGVSFVVPIAEGDLNLSTGDKGWLDASIFIGTCMSKTFNIARG
jgi:VNT family MFS transporter (synaptic vesicle glycoprotein 2)